MTNDVRNNNKYLIAYLLAKVTILSNLWTLSAYGIFISNDWYSQYGPGYDARLTLGGATKLLLNMLCRYVTKKNQD